MDEASWADRTSGYRGLGGVLAMLYFPTLGRVKLWLEFLSGDYADDAACGDGDGDEEVVAEEQDDEAMSARRSARSTTGAGAATNWQKSAALAEASGKDAFKLGTSMQKCVSRLQKIFDVLRIRCFEADRTTGNNPLPADKFCTDADITRVVKNAKHGDFQTKVATRADNAAQTATDFLDAEKRQRISMKLAEKSQHTSRLVFNFTCASLSRPCTFNYTTWAGMCRRTFEDVGPTRGHVLVFLELRSKNNQTGQVRLVNAMRHKDPLLCPVGATAIVLFLHGKDDPEATRSLDVTHPDFSTKMLFGGDVTGAHLATRKVDNKKKQKKAGEDDAVTRSYSTAMRKAMLSCEIVTSNVTKAGRKMAEYFKMRGVSSADVNHHGGWASGGTSSKDGTRSVADTSYANKAPVASACLVGAGHSVSPERYYVARADAVPLPAKLIDFFPVRVRQIIGKYQLAVRLRRHPTEGHRTGARSSTRGGLHLDEAGYTQVAQRSWPLTVLWDMHCNDELLAFGRPISEEDVKAIAADLPDDPALKLRASVSGDMFVEALEWLVTTFWEDMAVLSMMEGTRDWMLFQHDEFATAAFKAFREQVWTAHNSPAPEPAGTDAIAACLKNTNVLVAAQRSARAEQASGVDELQRRFDECDLRSQVQYDRLATAVESLTAQLQLTTLQLKRLQDEVGASAASAAAAAAAATATIASRGGAGGATSVAAQAAGSGSGGGGGGGGGGGSGSDSGSGGGNGVSATAAIAAAEEAVAVAKLAAATAAADARAVVAAVVANSARKRQHGDGNDGTAVEVARKRKKPSNDDPPTYVVSAPPRSFRVTIAEWAFDSKARAKLEEMKESRREGKGSAVSCQLIPRAVGHLEATWGEKWRWRPVTAGSHRRTTTTLPDGTVLTRGTLSSPQKRNNARLAKQRSAHVARRRAAVELVLRQTALREMAAATERHDRSLISAMSLLRMCSTLDGRRKIVAANPRLVWRLVCPGLSDDHGANDGQAANDAGSNDEATADEQAYYDTDPESYGADPWGFWSMVIRVAAQVDEECCEQGQSRGYMTRALSNEREEVRKEEQERAEMQAPAAPSPASGAPSPASGDE